MSIHIFGIRHHGPGSARHVRRFLELLTPDIVLVEGPPEADDLLRWAGNPGMRPPVAILCYQPDKPEASTFYPFAVFSPEWQAITYARERQIPVRFMDLPAGQQMALTEATAAASSVTPDPALAPPPAAEPSVAPHRSAMAHLAEAAGYADHETFWEHTFEYRIGGDDVFEAVDEAMSAVRTETTEREDPLEAYREAHMRKVIRQAEREMFTRIAVICGAWHAPALRDMPKQKDDNELLKGLPKVKIECTWVPWTYGRLSFASGYGAGIHSPGWYDHLWQHPTDDGVRWMSRVARLFRKQQMDISVAHVIEAVRLAGSLAALRGLSRPGLDEFNEATLSVLCNGEGVMMTLLQRELIVSDKLGAVPDEVPRPPLHLDIERLQKKLRLPASPDEKEYNLDLRKELDLERSIFLHRLEILGLKWAQKYHVNGKGTFKEQWTLQWDPALAVEIIDKGKWGNTAEEAAGRYLMDQAGPADLPKVCALLERAIPAELPSAVAELVLQVNNRAAASSDVMQLMSAIPTLAGISRYGNVRGTDEGLIGGIVNSMIDRVCVSLPSACTAVDEASAGQFAGLVQKVNDAVSLLDQAPVTEDWTQTLSVVSGSPQSAPLLGGYATRLLADRKLFTGGPLVKSFHYAMSSASAPAQAAAWLEGFLKGSGTLLLLDKDLWSVVSDWVAGLEETVFMTVLPLLRRTFAHFTTPERRKLGEKVRGGASSATAVVTGLDTARAERGVPVILSLLGYNPPTVP